MKIYPFNDDDTFSTFSNLMKKITNEIKSLDNDYVLNASNTELEEYYLSKVTIEPIELYIEDYHIEEKIQIQKDVSHDFSRAIFPGERAFVPGTKLRIAIPFNGNEGLWRIRPSTYSISGYPEIEIKNDRIIIEIEYADDSVNIENIKAQINREISSISNAISNLNLDVNSHNASIKGNIISSLRYKRKLAEEGDRTLHNLGIPIKKRDTPLSYTVPTVRKIIINKPIVSTQKYKPEPILSEDEYQNILKIIKSMSLVIERNPKAFSNLDEEAIRTHFLLQLNGHYEGNATGETFNASGKTDILIRVENKNIFIAECKIWRGQKYFNESIDQLLSYLSWRDSKTAILVFNRTKDTSTILTKMEEIIQERTELVKTIYKNKDGESRYIFVKPSEPGKEIILTTQIYDIPSA
jgi:hypothetical protein